MRYIRSIIDFRIDLLRKEELNRDYSHIQIYGAIFVNVEFKQNRSWKGVIQWLEKEKTRSF